MIKHTSCNRTQNTPRSLLVWIVLLCFLFITACSSSDDDSTVQQPGVTTPTTPGETPTTPGETPTTPGETPTTPGETPTTPGETPTTPGETPTTPDETPTTPGEIPSPVGAMQFPVDTDSDDRPTLIVTGLNGADPSTVVTPWLAIINTFRMNSITPGTGDGDVGFIRYPDDFPVSVALDFYDLELEVCEITDPEAPPPVNEGGGDGGDPPPPYISAGTSVTINTPSGPWFVLERDLVNGEPRYQTDNGFPGALPENATLSVPGDEFPTIPAHPLFEPIPPVRLLPDSEVPLTADSTYSWFPEGNGQYVGVDFLAFDANNDFVAFAGYCRMIDDGIFVMPEEVRNFMASTNFRIQARYSRTYARLDFVNGIAIQQRMVVAE